MAINIGNQFEYGREAIDYGKVPLWDAVDEQYPSGAYFKGNSKYTEGKTVPAGTPVEIGSVGGEVKVGSEAEKPTGLTRYDATVAKGGCTLTIVTRGAIYADRIDKGEEEAALTEAQITALAGRILFINETAAI